MQYTVGNERIIVDTFLYWKQNHWVGIVAMIVSSDTTVDGRNPAPVEVGSLSHYIVGLVAYIPCGWEWDFWTIDSIK